MDKQKIMKNMADAMTFIGQAQEAAPHMTDLWHILGKLYDRIDEELDMLKDNQYTDEGQLID